MNWRFFAGLVLGLTVGFGCRWLGVPSPAPPVLVGALLVVAMTSGYQLADLRLARKPSLHGHNSGGPTGTTNKERAP